MRLILFRYVCQLQSISSILWSENGTTLNCRQIIHLFTNRIHLLSYFHNRSLVLFILILKPLLVIIHEIFSNILLMVYHNCCIIHTILIWFILLNLHKVCLILRITNALIVYSTCWPAIENSGLIVRKMALVLLKDFDHTDFELRT